jgi:trehalose/maltose hydrolase-like predicted phosphorylase
MARRLSILATAGVTVGIVIVTVPFAGCTPSGPNTDNTTSPLAMHSPADTGAFRQLDPWLLTTTDVNANRGNHGVFLGNGGLGATFDATGGGGGKDAIAFAAGRYDPAEALEPIANWQDLNLPAPNGADYQQTLDMRSGVLTTKSGSTTVTAFVCADAPNSAVVHIQGATSAPPVVAPTGLGLPGDTDPLSVQDTPVKDGQWTRVVTYLPGAGGAASYHPPSDFDAALRSQQAAWKRIWNDADIQIDGDPEAQQLVHKLMFDLLQSTRPGEQDSVPPESLSGDFYKGHIFWDAEVWMFPALLAQHPDFARAILEYRFRHLEQARAIARAEGCAGADFPWESAASGNDVAPADFQKERHVTADVGWAYWQYWLATGDRSWLIQRGWPVMSAVADYWASRAKRGADGAYHIDGVVGPDENAGVVNDNTYTNAMARNCLNAATAAAQILGEPARPNWATVAAKLALPFDHAHGRYLTRADDNGRQTKQADGELTIYPAAAPMDPKTEAATFDYNAARPIKNGPAMTNSIHALIAARLGRAAEAEQDFRDSYRPFVRGPFLLFSEKRTLDRCVFTTGAGGVLQAVIYGFGGLDFSRPDGIVAGKPSLPAGWRRLTITGIRRGGKRYTLTVTPDARRLTPAG